MQETESMDKAAENDNAPEGKGALSAAEAAYFASRGASGLPDAAEAEERRAAAAEAEERSAAAARAAQGSAARVKAAPVKTPPPAALPAEEGEGHNPAGADLREMQAQARAWQRDLAAYAQMERSGGAGQTAPAAPAAAERAAPPDPREDFLGFARWQGEEINRLSRELGAQRSREAAAARAQAAETALMREWENAVSAARNEHADIDGALEFLSDARLRQLGALAAADSRFADRAFCEKQIFAELRDIIIGTFQQGVNPAKAVYGLAKAYGYGGDETARMERLSAAAGAARSLTAGAGAQAGDPFLLETVANMSEAEFAKWYEKNKSRFRQLFGG